MMIHRIVGAAFVLMLPAVAASAQEARDARADDAVLLFSNLCGGIVAKLDMAPDDGRYRIVQVDPESAAAAIPSLDGEALWSVSAPGSDARMLHYVTKGGICGVEVAEADPAAIDRDFKAYVHALAVRWSVEAILRQDSLKDGFRMRIWRLRSPDGAIDLGLGAFPNTEPQHILTMARARNDAAPAERSGASPDDPADPA